MGVLTAISVIVGTTAGTVAALYCFPQIFVVERIHLVPITVNIPSGFTNLQVPPISKHAIQFVENNGLSTSAFEAAVQTALIIGGTQVLTGNGLSTSAFGAALQTALIASATQEMFVADNNGLSTSAFGAAPSTVATSAPRYVAYLDVMQ